MDAGGGKTEGLRLPGIRLERAELHEMIAAAARAQLGAGPVEAGAGHRRHAPVLVEHVVLAGPGLDIDEDATRRLREEARGAWAQGAGRSG